MKKILNMIVIFVIIIGIVVTITGCKGVDLSTPLFVKALCYSDDMDLDIYYIADTSWEKKVKCVEIPNAPEDIETVVYDETKDDVGGYVVTTVAIGVNSDELDESTYGLKKDLEFHSLQITWDDDSRTLADIGHMTVTAKDGYSGPLEMGETVGLSDEGRTTRQSMEATATMDFQAKYLDIPYEKEVGGVFENFQTSVINDTDQKNMANVMLKKGDTYKVTYDVDNNAMSEYGIIDTTIYVCCKMPDGSERFSAVGWLHRMGLDTTENIKAYCQLRNR